MIRTPRIYVIIPVRDQFPLLRVVLDALRHEASDLSVIVQDNGSNAETKYWLAQAADEWPGELTVVDTEGLSIYQMWNAGWIAASIVARVFEQDEFEVAFLNSDVNFVRNTLYSLALTLRFCPLNLGAVAPDYTCRVEQGSQVISDSRGPSVREVHGSYREGGLPGWCFMVRGELDLRVDEQFEWWYGDDDLFRQIEQSGYKLGLVKGLPLDHVNEGTARHHPEIHEAKGRDAERFAAKWGVR